MIIRVEIWTEEFGDDIGFLMRSRSEILAGAVSRRAVGTREALFVVTCMLIWCRGTILNRQERFLFRLKGLGKIVNEWLKRRVELNMEQGNENKENDHQDDWTWCLLDTEESN